VRALKERGYAHRETSGSGIWARRPESMPIHFGFDPLLSACPKRRPPSFIEGDQPTAGVSLRAAFAGLRRSRPPPSSTPTRPRPFLLVLPAPHSAQAESPGGPRSAALRGVNAYCDTVLELDWFVGKIVDLLKTEGLDRDTIVVFTSDNGPVEEAEGGGSTGPFLRPQAVRERGAGFVCRPSSSWPGHIPAGRVISEPTTTLDLFPTPAGARPAARCARIAPYDGEDILDLLSGAA